MIKSAFTGPVDDMLLDICDTTQTAIIEFTGDGNVQNRLGTVLRKLRKERKREGGGACRLTDAMIDKLQNYYGIAIRSNSGDLQAMKRAIYARFFHCASSQNWNLHTHCPEGADSWCGFMKDRANRTNTLNMARVCPWM